MTQEERQQQFAAAYSALVARFGVQIVGTVQQEQLGAVLQVRPVLGLQLVNDWKQPAAVDELAYLQAQLNEVNARHDQAVDTLKEQALHVVGLAEKVLEQRTQIPANMEATAQ